MHLKLSLFLWRCTRAFPLLSLTVSAAGAQNGYKRARPSCAYKGCFNIYWDSPGVAPIRLAAESTRRFPCSESTALSLPPSFKPWEQRKNQKGTWIVPQSVHNIGFYTEVTCTEKMKMDIHLSMGIVFQVKSWLAFLTGKSTTTWWTLLHWGIWPMQTQGLDRRRQRHEMWHPTRDTDIQSYEGKGPIIRSRVKVTENNSP